MTKQPCKLKRVSVSNSASNCCASSTIISRIQKLNPNVQIIDTPQNILPNRKLTGKKQYNSDEYKNLIYTRKQNLNLSKVEKNRNRAVKYETEVNNQIEKTHSNSKMCSMKQNLQQTKQGDKRWRYSEVDRIAIYSKMIKELGGSAPSLQLSAENPNISDKVSLDKNIIHSGLVYQYSNDTKNDENK